MHNFFQANEMHMLNPLQHPKNIKIKDKYSSLKFIVIFMYDEPQQTPKTHSGQTYP